MKGQLRLTKEVKTRSRRPRKLTEKNFISDGDAKALYETKEK